MYRISRRKLPLDITYLQLIKVVLNDGNFTEAKWFDLGLELAINEPTLKTFECASFANNSSRCLREVLALWLKSDGTCNGGRLANALEAMNEKEAADRIRQIFVDSASQLYHCFRKRLCKLELSEESVELLCKEGVISRDTLVVIESSGGYLVDDSVVIAICTTIAEDHCKLKILIAVLLRFDETKSLGHEMLNDYNERFVSEVVQSESTQIPAHDSTNYTSDSTESVDATHCKVYMFQDNLDRTDQVSFDRIRDSLGILIHKIALLIEAAIPSVSSLIMFLETCRPELQQELQLAGRTFDAVLRVIRMKCSVINITLLEAIVKQYSITEAGEYIVAYNDQMTEFCTHLRSLRICNNKQLRTFFAAHLTCETITFTLNWEINEHTFNDIKDLLMKAFKDLANRVEVVKICEGNSITITCYAPHHLMESLLLIVKCTLTVLKDEGLMRLIIGHNIVYDQKAIDEEVRKMFETLLIEKDVQQNEDMQWQEKEGALKQLLESKTKEELKEEIEILKKSLLLEDKKNLQQLQILKEYNQNLLSERRKMFVEIDQLRLDFRKVLNEKEKKEEELHQLTKTVCIQQELLQNQNYPWVIDQEELIMTEETLGMGSYGQVNVGIFRSLKVAVKSLHPAIISDYNLALFAKEVNIVSRVRHPNLVQFIGATKVGNPLILTEIMTTNLCNELQKKGPLPRQEIISISRDIALSLNYLHLWKPDAIIHKDVSSSNVLLELLVDGSYKTKLCDFGSANFQYMDDTIMPGKQLYAAPESCNPDKHSTSMDVYSYCVLLMEMTLHSPPALTVRERELQVLSIGWSPIKSLIQGGLSIDIKARPTMTQILEKLKDC